MRSRRGSPQSLEPPESSKNVEKSFARHRSRAANRWRREADSSHDARYPAPTPASAARANQVAAAASSFTTPRPSASMRPYQYCASATPSEARFNQKTARSSSRGSPNALREADRIVVRRDQVALPGCPFEPFVHGRRLIRQNGRRPRLHKFCQIGLCAQESPASAARLEPGNRLVDIPRYPRPGKMEHAERTRRAPVASFRGGSKPVSRLAIVRLPVAAPGVQVTQLCGGFTVASQSSIRSQLSRSRGLRGRRVLRTASWQASSARGEPRLRRDCVSPPRLSLVQGSARAHAPPPHRAGNAPRATQLPLPERVRDARRSSLPRFRSAAPRRLRDRAALRAIPRGNSGAHSNAASGSRKSSGPEERMKASMAWASAEPASAACLAQIMAAA